MRRPAARPSRGFGLAGSGGPATAEERAAIVLLVLLHIALVVALALAAGTLVKYWDALQLPPWQKVAFEVGLGVAMLSFVVRGVRLARRLRAPVDRT
jgi:hypothetical protein